jgi:hypothetical protein
MFDDVPKWCDKCLRNALTSEIEATLVPLTLVNWSAVWYGTDQNYATFFK